MKLVALTIYKWKEDSPVELFTCNELGFVPFFPFYLRSNLRDQIKFHSRLVSGRTQIGSRQSTDDDLNIGKFHSWVHPQGVAAVICADGEYPMRVAFTLLSEAIRIFLEQNAGKWEDVPADTAIQCPDIEVLFAKFQDPSEGDKLAKIEKDLDEAKGIVMQSVEDLLKRGESLDSLMQKSKDLTDASVDFYRQAKRNNQCWLMRLLQDVFSSRPHRDVAARS